MGIQKLIITFLNKYKVDNVVNVGIKGHSSSTRVISSVSESGDHWFSGLMLSLLN